MPTTDTVWNGSIDYRPAENVQETAIQTSAQLVNTWRLVNGHSVYTTEEWWWWRFGLRPQTVQWWKVYSLTLLHFISVFILWQISIQIFDYILLIMATVVKRAATGRDAVVRCFVWTLCSSRSAIIRWNISCWRPAPTASWATGRHSTRH